MKRRDFLKSSAAISTAAAFPGSGRLFLSETAASAWRTFEVTTRVELLHPAGISRIWLPGALLTDTSFQKTISNSFEAPSGKARLISSKPDGLALISAEFPESATPVLTVKSVVMTRDYLVDLKIPAGHAKLSNSEREHFLRPTKLIPTDGIVKETSLQITKGAGTEVEKARAIYEWVVDNTFRNPKTRGCGAGDIRFMLETKDLGGKCADLNALYVGLARSAGLPARDVYGIRVAKSELGYKSLGASSEVITKSQHCRAEVFLDGFGWVPVDPADVRKVVLEEPPGNRALDDDMVKRARARLFGSWEMNWMAYNFAHDVELAGSTNPTVGFLMYPQAETGGKRLDCLDPDNFKYQITVKEIHSA